MRIFAQDRCHDLRVGADGIFTDERVIVVDHSSDLDRIDGSGARLRVGGIGNG